MYEKGYQDTDEVVSACSSKVKGVTYTNISYHDGVNDTLYQRIWDVADYVIPPQVNPTSGGYCPLSMDVRVPL